MSPESEVLLEDMRDAAREIRQMIGPTDLQRFQRDVQLRWAVERGFEIIGEALSQVRKREPELAERFSEWRQIIGFRNVLAHAYAVVDDAKTWEIATHDLPVLLRELDELLGPEQS